MIGSGSPRPYGLCKRRVLHVLPLSCVKSPVANVASGISTPLAGAADGSFVPWGSRASRTDDLTLEKKGIRTFIAGKTPLVLDPMNALHIQTQNVIPNPDAISEVRVNTEVINPEYNRKSVGYLKAGTKCGTGRSPASLLNLFLLS